MLIIRKEHKQAFSKAVMENFECRIYAHVTRIWPEQCKRLEETAVRELIRRGIREALDFGIDEEYEVSRYVDLMFILSPDFSTSDRFPWAAAVLKDAAMKPAAKMDRLYERAEKELRASRRDRPS